MSMEVVMRTLLFVSLVFMCTACAQEPPPEKDGWDLLDDSGGSDAVASGDGHESSDQRESTQPSATPSEASDSSQPAGTEPAAGEVDCVSGATGWGSMGDDWTCHSKVTCDGVEYKIDCFNEDCSCIVDGELSAEISTDQTCTYFGMRECGAPIPPVNPDCHDDQIWSGGGVGDDGGFCETGTICNDVFYRLECLDDTGECTCFVNDEPGPVSTATTDDCIDGQQRALRECGAALRPRP